MSLKTFLARLASKPKVTELVTVRLTDEQLKEFRRRVNGTAVVTASTTDLMAGYQLGINHALNVLQEGFTISRT